MPTITCQYTSVKFEAKTARTKNHPLVSAFLSELSKERDFSYALALESFKSNAFETAEEYIAQARQEIKARYEKIASAKQAEREAQKAREQKQAEAKARRDAQNAHLKAHGYVWDTEARYGNEYDERGTEVWVLYDPQGAPISVEQALAEIERGAEVVRAEIEAAKQAELAAKFAEEQAIAQATNERKNYETVLNTETIGMAVIQADFSDIKILEVVYNTDYHKIERGTYRNQPAIIATYKSALDDHTVIYTPFFNTKTKSDTPTLADTFAMFFS